MAFKYIGKKSLNLTKRIGDRPAWFTFNNGDLIPDELINQAKTKTKELEEGSKKEIKEEEPKEIKKPKKTKIKK